MTDNNRIDNVVRITPDNHFFGERRIRVMAFDEELVTHQEIRVEFKGGTLKIPLALLIKMKKKK